MPDWDTLRERVADEPGGPEVALSDPAAVLVRHFENSRPEHIALGRVASPRFVDDTSAEEN